MVFRDFSYPPLSVSTYQHDNKPLAEGERECACACVAKLPTTRASDEKKKMIRQTLVHSLKKLFDKGLMGLTAVVFG